MKLEMKEMPNKRAKVSVMIGEHECKVRKSYRGRRSKSNEIECDIPRIKQAGMYQVKLTIDGKQTTAAQTI